LRWSWRTTATRFLPSAFSAHEVDCDDYQERALVLDRTAAKSVAPADGALRAGSYRINPALFQVVTADIR
jgi:hypothetical protein